MGPIYHIPKIPVDGLGNNVKKEYLEVPLDLRKRYAVNRQQPMA